MGFAEGEKSLHRCVIALFFEPSVVATIVATAM